MSFDVPGVPLQRNAAGFTSVDAQRGHRWALLLRHEAEWHSCDVGPGWDPFVVIGCIWS